MNKVRGKPEFESRETIMSSFKNYFEPDKTITSPLRVTATHICQISHTVSQLQQ